jgi:hypothetical protein
MYSLPRRHIVAIRRMTNRGNDMARKEDVSKDSRRFRSRLEQLIEGERGQLLQARGVLKCLRDVLLHAEGRHSVSYADVAHVAARLIEKSLERLDSVRVQPLIEELKSGVAHCEAGGESPDTGSNEVRDRRGVYLH